MGWEYLKEQRKGRVGIDTGDMGEVLAGLKINRSDK